MNSSLSSMKAHSTPASESLQIEGEITATTQALTSSLSHLLLLLYHSFSEGSSLLSELKTQLYLPIVRSIPSFHLKFKGMVPKRQSLQTLPIFVEECIDNQNTSFNSCLQNWVRWVPLMVRVDWSLEVDFNLNRLKMF